MSKLTGTIIGGGIGWALLGPLGALIGAYIGNVFASDTPRTTYVESDSERVPYQTFGDTRAGDFAVAMLSLFAYITKSDQTVRSSEIQYVKNYLVEKFGRRNAQDLLYLYREILRKTFNIRDVTAQIKAHMDYYARMELVHVLFGIAGADGNYHKLELEAIQTVADGLGIHPNDYQTIKAIFIGQANQSYAILGVSPEDDTETIKKIYRDLATKYHPDKVVNLGPEIQKLAEEKFKSINEAYQNIRRERGF